MELGYDILDYGEPQSGIACPVRTGFGGDKGIKEGLSDFFSYAGAVIADGDDNPILAECPFVVTEHGGGDFFLVGLNVNIPSFLQSFRAIFDEIDDDLFHVIGGGLYERQVGGRGKVDLDLGCVQN